MAPAQIQAPQNLPATAPQTLWRTQLRWWPLLAAVLPLLTRVIQLPLCTAAFPFRRHRALLAATQLRFQPSATANQGAAVRDLLVLGYTCSGAISGAPPQVFFASRCPSPTLPVSLVSITRGPVFLISAYPVGTMVEAHQQCNCICCRVCAILYAVKLGVHELFKKKSWGTCPR